MLMQKARKSSSAAAARHHQHSSSSSSSAGGASRAATARLVTAPAKNMAARRPTATAAALPAVSPGGITPDDTVLAIGVTGITGRCALDGLIAGGVAPSQILALTRDPSSSAARRVAARGATPIAADLDDADATVAPLLDRARFVYVHALSGDASSADPAELRRGRALAELLRARQAAAGGGNGSGGANGSGLGLVIYNSSAGRGADAGISQMDQKHLVADTLRGAGAPFLGLEATMFMEEFWKRYTRPSIVTKGVFPFSLPADKPLQMVAARDVGYAAALAMRDPARHAGRNVPLAGDALTPAEMCAAFAAAQSGAGGGAAAAVRQSAPPAWVFWFLSRDLWRITKFLREKGYGADVAACRAAFPGLLTFPEFLAASRWGDAARTYEDGIEFDFGAAGAGSAGAPVTAAAAQQQQGQ